MANTFITPDVLAPEATRILKNESILFNLFRNPQDEARFTGNEKVGDTIKIVSPGPADVREFTGTASARDVTETSRDLTVEKHYYDAVNVTSADMALELQDFSAKIVQPIMVGLAEQLAAYAATKLVGVPYWSGTAGDPPDTKTEITQLDRLLNTNKVPGPGRISVVDEWAKADILAIDGFSDADRRGDDGTTLREASMGRIYGFDWMMDQSIADHTAGTMQPLSPLVDVGGGVLVDAVTMDIDEIAGGTETILTGDLFTVAGVSGYQGVFTNDTTAVGGQITAATFYPPAPVGGFPDDAALTIIGDHTKNVAYGPGAFTAVTFPPPAARGAGESAAFFDDALGFGVRVTFWGDFASLSDNITFDLLAGCEVRHRELAAILLG